MKNYKLFLIVLIISLAGSNACNLEENPNFLSSTNLFNDVNGAKIALNGVYAGLNGFEYYNSEFHHALNWTSGMYNSNRDGSLLDIAALNPNTNDKFIENLWTGIYRTINRANNMIVQLETKDLGDPAKRDEILGQVLFIRAIGYFDLVRAFGKAPLVTGIVDGNDPDYPLSTKEEIFDQIIQDCKRATVLMADLGKNEPGRPARYAANMLLAKVYMWQAGNKTSQETDLWQKAYDEASVVLNKYQLMDDFRKLWLDNTRNNTVESIFEIQANVETSNNLMKYWSASNAHIGRTTWARFKPNLEVYDLHVNTYPDDPRISQTFVTSYNKYAANGTSTVTVTYPTFTQRGNRDKSYPFGKKYYIQDETMVNTDIGWNYTVFRYAELLLMMAEIENELRGPSEAYQYINQVLSRARKSSDSPALNPADWSGLSQQEFRDAITLEYIFELQQEGMDFFHVRRRGWDFFREFVILRHNSHPKYDFTKSMDLLYPDNPRIMVLPIPESEINTNSKITSSDQNPGY